MILILRLCQDKLELANTLVSKLEPHFSASSPWELNKLCQPSSRDNTNSSLTKILLTVMRYIFPNLRQQWESFVKLIHDKYSCWVPGGFQRSKLGKASSNRSEHAWTVTKAKWRLLMFLQGIIKMLLLWMGVRTEICVFILRTTLDHLNMCSAPHNLVFKSTWDVFLTDFLCFTCMLSML